MKLNGGKRDKPLLVCKYLLVNTLEYGDIRLYIKLLLVYIRGIPVETGRGKYR